MSSVYIENTCIASTLQESHKTQLQSHYGIKPANPVIEQMIADGILTSISAEQARTLLNRADIDSSGMLLRYPNKPDTFTVRLDEPIERDGKKLKYLRAAGQSNCLFIPPAVQIDSQEPLFITEGEFKALAGALRGLQVVAISGVWSWRTAPQTETSEVIASTLANDDKLPDNIALIPELNKNWDKRKIYLLYDSDITQKHKAWTAFGRLAEQLYRLGAYEVNIISLPALEGLDKTGLDDFISYYEKQSKNPIALLHTLVSKAYIWLPTKEGVSKFAEIRLQSTDTKDRILATASLLTIGNTEALNRLKNIVKGKERESILKDAKKYLEEALSRQNCCYLPNRQETKNCLASPAYQEVNKRVNPEFNASFCLSESGRLQKKSFKSGGQGEGYATSYDVSVFVPWLEKEICKDNGIEQKIYFQVKGIAEGGNPLPRLVLSGEEMNSMDWPLEKWGKNGHIKPYPKAKEYIRDAIFSLGKEAAKETIYTHLGWCYINGKWVYLHAGGAIGGDSVQVELESKDLEKYCLPGTSANAQAAVKESLKLLDIAPAEISYPLWALIYLAPLRELFHRQSIEIGSVLILYGQSGTLKSSLSALCLCHFGKGFNSRNLPANLEDTINALEGKMFQAEDSLLVIDDLYPSKDKIELHKKQQTVQAILRRYGNCAGKARRKSDLTFRDTQRPRGLAILTVELLPQGASSLARGLLVEVKKGSINLAKLTEAQQNQDRLSESMRSYLEWVGKNFEEISRKLAEDFQKLRGSIQNKSDMHLRLSETQIFLYLGMMTGLQYAESIEAISKEKKEEILQNAWNTFQQLTSMQNEYIQDEKPSIRFLKVIHSLFIQSKIHVQGKDQEMPPDSTQLGWKREGGENDSTSIPQGDLIGWADADYLYLKSELAYKAFAKTLKEQDETPSVDAKTLWKQLDEEGKIEVDKTKQQIHRTVLEKIEGKQQRVLKLKRACLFSEEI